MLKKAMLYLMFLLTACRFVSMISLLANENAYLPNVVYLSTGLVVLLGASLTGRFILGIVKQRELCAFFAVQAAVILFNLFYMKVFTFMEVRPQDFLVIGTLVEVIVGIGLIVLAIRENRYVNVSIASKLQ